MTGRHRADTIRPVPADWSPLDPATRQAIAPTWWADRLLSAGEMDRTGLLDPNAVQEVLQSTTRPACGSSPATSTTDQYPSANPTRTSATSGPADADYSVPATAEPAPTRRNHP